MNVSKSGITPSIKTKRGSLSTKGYSVRTGISGVNYKKSFGKTKNSGCLLFLALSILIMTILIKF